MPTIPNVQPKIQRVLKKLGLTKYSSIKKAIDHPAKRFYYTRAMKNGQPVFFKARIRTAPMVKRSFSREIWLAKTMDQYQEFNLYKNLRRYLESYEGNDFEWLLLEYAVGQVMGEKYRLNLDYLTKQNIEQILAFLARTNDPALNRRLRHDDKKKIIPVYGYGKMKKDFYRYLRYCQQSAPELVNQKQLGRAERIFTGASKLLGQARYIKHGDFQPPNFIEQRGEINIIDWELARFANPLFDFAFLWVDLWRYPRLQRQMLRGLNKISPELSTSDLKKLFRANAVMLTLLQLRALHQFFNTPQDWKPTVTDRRDRRQALKRHQQILSRLLRK